MGKKQNQKQTQTETKRKAAKKGKHPENALSAVNLKNLGTGFYCDGGGLYLQVTGEARSWILCTSIHGKRRYIGLGGLKFVSLAEARDKAFRMRKVARTGGDPLAVKWAEQDAAERERSMPTFRACAIEAHAEYAKTFRNRNHSSEWLGSLERWAFPHIGDMRIDQIESNHVLMVLKPVWTSKPHMAGKVKQRVKRVFQWSIAHRYRTLNPTVGLEEVMPKQNGMLDKHFAAMPYMQVPAFIHDLRASDQAESARLALEFLILTATRTSETRLATWSEIDKKAKTWTIPAARMKMQKEHRVPLTARMLAILEAAEKISDGSEFIFPGHTKGNEWSNVVFLEVMKRMKREFTVHGFRSSFRDWAEEKTSHGNRTIESALAHQVPNKTEAAYLRTDSFEKRRELMTAWERFATTKAGEKVVRFKS